MARKRIYVALYILTGISLIATGIMPFIKTVAYSELYAVEYDSKDGYAWAEGYSAPICLSQGSYKLVVTGSTTALEANTAFVVSLVNDETYDTAASVSGIFYLKEVPLNISDSEYFSRMTLPEDCTATLINHRASVFFILRSSASIRSDTKACEPPVCSKARTSGLNCCGESTGRFLLIPTAVFILLIALLWTLKSNKARAAE